MERTECLAKNSAFINLKDHKENFQASLTCHHINPYSTWSSSTVIEWFKGIGNKKEYIFIKFDLREFYSSISESIFKKGILFAKKYHHISDEDVRIINQCQKSLLLNENEPWKKKQLKSYLDVTMGGYDGALIFELVGIYILTHLAKIIKKSNCRLYRNYGLVILCNLNRQ